MALSATLSNITYDLLACIHQREFVLSTDDYSQIHLVLSVIITEVYSN